MLNRRRLSSVVMVLAVGLVLVAEGCGSGDGVLGVNEGRVQFLLSSDAEAAVPNAASPEGPVATDGDHGHGYHQFFQSASVTFSSILARNVDGVLENVTLDPPPPITVDVVSMDGGKEIMLPEGQLPAATYDQVVVVMTWVEGVTLDGTTIAITPPGGGWTAIVPMCPFVVGDGGTTTVSLKFMLNQAFSWRNSRYHFQPRFVCEEI
ncbi:MAG: hypothetical protein AMS18_16890 [Gemmatimonas sp. SG8_17]|nr:MAG: hypothetical protein AMS18_16890 [Gemmatimonas sp. SG8_17]